MKLTRKPIGGGVKRGGLMIDHVRRGISGGSSNSALRRGGERLGAIGLDAVHDEIDRFAKEQTGALKKSFSVKVEQKKGTLRVFITSTSRYARIHDRGGVIEPKNGKALTIPATRALRGVRARGIPGMHRRGNALYKGNTKMFFLAKRVRIKPKRYLQKAMRLTNRRVNQAFDLSVRDLAAGMRRV